MQDLSISIPIECTKLFVARTTTHDFTTVFAVLAIAPDGAEYQTSVYASNKEHFQAFKDEIANWQLVQRINDNSVMYERDALS